MAPVTDAVGRPVVDAVVVGSGIAGLVCATALRGRGLSPVVFERSRGVGGRCATRRVHGQPVDHGAAFFHGFDSGFLEELGRVPGATVLDGWPREVDGVGPPCVPKAFEPLERRLAYVEGVTVFPKHLARGLDVRLETPVVRLSSVSGGLKVETEGGASFQTPNVVLAVPPPTALKLVAPLAGDTREASAVLALMGMIGSQSCLTVLAGYPLDMARPSWDIHYPADSACVQMISHDSAKREAPGFVVLVIQARPGWSLAQLETPEETWAAGLIHEAGRLVGAWAGKPAWVEAHRWRFARADRGSGFCRPLALRVSGGGRVIITGESFAPGGGLEAAWLAGKASARRLVEEE